MFFIMMMVLFIIRLMVSIIDSRVSRFREKLNISIIKVLLIRDSGIVIDGIIEVWMEFRYRNIIISMIIMVFSRVLIILLMEFLIKLEVL